MIPRVNVFQFQFLVIFYQQYGYAVILRVNVFSDIIFRHCYV